jgi:hypothetical protein
MQTNLIFVANFAPNPFLPVSGSYSGLFYDTNGVTQTSSGAFRLTVATKGGYSGYLQIGNQRLALKGKFELDGSAMSTAKGGHNLSPLTVWLQLDLANGTGQVVGSVSNAVWTASLLGDREVFNSRSNAWPLARRYTLSLPGDSQAEVSPIGDGYGMVSITPSGQLSLMGSVADGAKFSQGVQVSMSTLSTNVQWPLYVPLYKGQGSLLSWITISNQGLGGAVTWIKPASTGGGFYTNGFNLSLVSLGSRYDPPQGAGNVLSLTNAQLALSGGNLDSAFTNEVAFGTGNQVTNSSTSEPKLNLRFTPATGLFRGSIVPPGRTQPVSLNGVALQDQDLGSGYFLDTTLGGQVRLEQ